MKTEVQRNYLEIDSLKNLFPAGFVSTDIDMPLAFNKSKSVEQATIVKKKKHFDYKDNQNIDWEHVFERRKFLLSHL